MGVKENLQWMKDRLPAQVTLVAVSKTKPPDMVMEAYRAGHRDFGENYVQELVDKEHQLPKDIRWHFIGHLQSNKVKYIASFVHLIHGVDSLKLLAEINKQAAKCGRVIQCLLQVHIAQEDTKFGLTFEECETALAASVTLEHVKVTGFMAMASNTDQPEQVRREFRSLKGFYERMKPAYPYLTVLSYGMSGDYQIAVEEGSTMVRIGSTIFGQRD